MVGVQLKLSSRDARGYRRPNPNLGVTRRHYGLSTKASDDVISSPPPELEVVHFKRSVNASGGGSAERVARERASLNLSSTA